MLIPDVSTFIIQHFFDLSLIGAIYFSPTYFHKTLKNQGGNARLYIMINFLLGWTVIFWIVCFYKAFYK